MELVRRADGALALEANGMSLCGDFSGMLGRLRPHNLSRELLVRAARIRGAHDRLRAVDATAGLGEDALLLAAAGFDVMMFERDQTIAALLADALARARQDVRLADIVSHMRLVEGDAVEGLAHVEGPLDVVYLDPMFPSKRKEAATNKKLQMFRMLQKPCNDEEAAALLQAALACGARKVVVKRPLKGPYLADVRPSHSIKGKVVRYDVIVR